MTRTRRTLECPRRQASHTVLHRLDPRLFRAVRAAEEPPVRLHAVADDAAPAVCARRRQHLNRTLERVERMYAVAHRDRERLVVIVATQLAGRHGALSSDV